MVFFESEIFEVSFRVGDHDQIHCIALVTDLQRCLFIELGQFAPRRGTVTFRLPSSDATSLRSVESRCNRSRSD